MWGSVREAGFRGIIRGSLMTRFSNPHNHWPGMKHCFNHIRTATTQAYNPVSSLKPELCHPAVGKYDVLVEKRENPVVGTPLLFPSGEVEEVSIPERMRLISWLAQHNAIDVSFFCARAKHFEPLGPNDERPVDYSWVELTLKLSDPNATRLRDVFRQSSQPDALRSGRLLEVLDCFASDIAFSYCRPSIALNENKTDLFVTVAIDSIRLFDQENVPVSAETSGECPYISVSKDLTLRGFVSYAGSSSVEITAELHQDGRLIGSAFLVFVHVGQDGRPKKCIPPLSTKCDNPEILLQLHQAAERQRARKELASKGGSFLGPDREEAEFLHHTWTTTKNSSQNVKWIQDTRLDSNILMQPETISIYGRAFGGYIMRSALELSVLTAQRFLAQTTPIITGMEDIRFFDAVKQGDILHLSSHVVWSDYDEIQIQVEASSSSVGKPMKRTNALVFYYKQSPELQRQGPFDIQVYPQKYADYMWFLEARRRALKRKGPHGTVGTA